jgi:hypothetical protein
VKNKLKISLIIITSIIVGCDSEQEKNIPTVDIINTEDDIDNLDSLCNENIIIEGTPTYDSILKFYEIQELTIIDHPIMEDSAKLIGYGVSMINYVDSIVITEFSYSKGSCLKFLPYSYKKDDTLFVNIPEKIQAFISYNSNDKEVTFEGCLYETYLETKFCIKQNLIDSCNTIVYKSKYFYNRNNIGEWVDDSLHE